MQIAAHVAHTCDSVGDKQRQNDFLASWNPIAKVGVNVHVPQAGDEKLAAPIHDLRISPRLVRRRLDCDDVSIANDHHLIRFRGASSYINHSDVCDRQGFPLFGGRSSREGPK